MKRRSIWCRADQRESGEEIDLASCRSAGKEIDLATQCSEQENGAFFLKLGYSGTHPKALKWLQRSEMTGFGNSGSGGGFLSGKQHVFRCTMKQMPLNVYSKVIVLFRFLPYDITLPYYCIISSFSNMENLTINLLNELDVSRDDYNIKVRIIRLWKLPMHDNPKQTYSIEMIMVDEQTFINKKGSQSTSIKLLI
ncbi:hypothetical protein R6Q59_012795 [Mikania micrantha]